MMARRLEDQEGRLAKIVREGKADGLVDPDLSVDAVVALCHAIGLGFSLLRTVQRPMPAADEWNELIARLIASAAPLSAPTPSRTQGASS